MNKTLLYYNQTAQKFIEGTIDSDLSDLHSRFMNYLPEGGHILDLGCGSGRDAKIFLEKDYQVTALDGSEVCCRLAEETIGQLVICQTFEQLDFKEKFDGIWACASLLHIPYFELTSIFKKAICALKPRGIFYASFKYGDFEGERNGRYFTDLTEERLIKLFKPIENFEIIETFVTKDVRKGREEEHWLNMIGIKRKYGDVENEHDRHI